MTYWGLHLTLDCSSCDKSKVKDKNNIINFAKELVQRIDMKAFGEPQVIHFGEGNKAGYTLVQLIETSNICAHFCDDSGDAYIDVFSCKTYDKKIVMDTVEEFFEPRALRVNIHERQAPIRRSAQNED